MYFLFFVSFLKFVAFLAFFSLNQIVNSIVCYYAFRYGARAFSTLMEIHGIKFSILL